MVGVPFVVAVDLRPGSAANSFDDAWKRASLAVIPAKIDSPVVGEHAVHLFAGAARKEIHPEVIQMTADVASEQIVADVGARSGGQGALDGAADVQRGVNQRPVHVEQV